VGSNFGLAVRGDGTLWAWGSNADGQLGDGTQTGQRRPVQIGTATDWVQVAVGQNFSLALKATGALYAWGSNSAGQLGTGVAASTPTAVGGGLVFAHIAAGAQHSLALTGAGKLYAWGSNSAGQLGIANAAATPTAVGSSYTFAQLAAGGQHSLALTAAGALYSWGDNTYGQLGSATTASAPTLVSLGVPLAQLAAGGQHSLALTAAGALYSWGDNTYGQLGLGNAQTVSAPTLVASAPTLTQIATGAAHSLALTPAGTLYAWGDNDSGELGLGTVSVAANAAFSQEATGGTSWTTLGVGSTGNFSLVRTTSAQDLSSTGANEAGQLGDGTTTTATRFDRLVPLQAVGAPAPLPVVLVRFGAQRTGPATAALTWTTASETNNLGFTVEKSSDGVTFAPLGFVAGAGSSTAAHAYTFTDAQATGLSYYRLAQLDQDGTVAYSPTQVVAGAAAALVLVPNPTRGPVRVLGLPSGATLEVYNALGQIVRPATPTLEVAGLPAGVYLVRATAPQQAPQTARLVVE
jgi:alpha-tubulin suppressor-like RCC1 family protein